MPMTYGIIRAATDGQEFTDVWERNEECYVYDIVHDGGIERYNMVILGLNILVKVVQKKSMRS